MFQPANILPGYEAILKDTAYSRLPDSVIGKSMLLTGLISCIDRPPTT